MDPISGTLLALVGGAGGEMGKQIWSSLCDLVRRPVRRRGSELQVGSGESELVKLEQEPSDTDCAVALSRVLAVRAEVDMVFRNELAALIEQAQGVLAETGSVKNIVSGGTVNGPLVQGRDFSNITFGNATPQPAPANGSEMRE